MKKLVAAALVALASPALADPPAGFDARVEALRVKAGVPGVAVAIVENGRVVLARGYGVRRLGSAEKVDGDTLFRTGSTGKAMTVAALATLVDAGKLGWDDHVVDRLPGFQMYDPWVTREMTVRDLLVHHSGLGLGAGDLLFVPRGSLSRAEIVRRLKYIKPATSFRSAYAYDNILYTVAGALIEAVSGQRYEDYLRDHVFRPAGMLSSTGDPQVRLATADRAWPHARTGGAVRGLGAQQVLDERDQLGQSSAPAGLLSISANDMGKWLQVQLAHGRLPNGGRLFSDASSAEMWKPVTIEPIAPLPPDLAGTQATFKDYALGWEVRDYAGTKIVLHTGAVFGFLTAVALIPKKNVGFAITINSEDSQVPTGLMYDLLDHYLGRPAQDWPARFAAFLDARRAAAAQTVTQAAATPARVGPSLPIARYTGTYADPWYGKVVVGSDARGLTINFATTPRMTGRLDHYQYDSFITRFDDPGIEPAYVTFSLGADGKVDRVTMKPVSPTADFSYDYQDLQLTPVKEP
ncbi:serine hydrolase [Sphingomonas sp. CROZ-RG-20F-R02-07]|uniref:serine hydrolase n=1 Tax=Sphingomonas sp. CROZ-RG-20F-R02-07 TaxID=2914832 RepID=UPI001F583767|nr:serine hydrolase [Sphingomonas sp. CROZ-RG-20F-R02-07]